MASHGIKSQVEKFNRMTGGFSEEELEGTNEERLRFLAKSKWFDSTGKEDERLTDRVADYLWEKLEMERDEKVAPTDIAKETED